MEEKKGSLLGGVLLIAGSCIGAGMLGLPIVAGLGGFTPSLFMFFLAWAFMTTTALLLVEANGWFSRQVNLLSMTEHALGKWGKGLCWITYLFLFYAVLIAYISGTGSLVSTSFQNAFGAHLPVWVGSAFFVLLFGWVVYLGTRKVDLCNRFLMIFKIGFFLLLVFLGVRYVQPKLLSVSDLAYAPMALPILLISFGFHNMIPSLTAYMKGDLKRVRKTIVGGSLLAFAIYVVWEILVLGTVPLYGENGVIASYARGQEASQAISAVIRSPWVRIFAQGLAFFAILTSFLAQSLSLVHFLADGMKISYKKRENLLLCAFALLPPLIISLLYPQLFFKALNFAGGVCTVILFGLLPVAMVWVGRYRLSSATGYQLPGGKPALVCVALFALFILIQQVATMCGIHLFPQRV